MIIIINHQFIYFKWKTPTVVYKIPYRRASRLTFRTSASREQRYLAYNHTVPLSFVYKMPSIAHNIPYRHSHAWPDCIGSVFRPSARASNGILYTIGVKAAFRPCALRSTTHNRVFYTQIKCISIETKI